MHSQDRKKTTAPKYLGCFARTKVAIHDWAFTVPYPQGVGIGSEIEFNGASYAVDRFTPTNATGMPAVFVSVARTSIAMPQSREIHHVVNGFLPFFKAIPAHRRSTLFHDRVVAASGLIDAIGSHLNQPVRVRDTEGWASAMSAYGYELHELGGGQSEPDFAGRLMTCGASYLLNFHIDRDWTLEEFDQHWHGIGSWFSPNPVRRSAQ